MTKKHLFFYFIPLLFVTKGYATNAQQPINLGETPWKFTKIIHKEINLAKDAQILYGTQVMSVIYNPQIEMFARFKMKSSFHKTKRII